MLNSNYDGRGALGTQWITEFGSVVRLLEVHIGSLRSDVKHLKDRIDSLTQVSVDGRLRCLEDRVHLVESGDSLRSGTKGGGTISKAELKEFKDQLDHVAKKAESGQQTMEKQMTDIAGRLAKLERVPTYPTGATPPVSDGQAVHCKEDVENLAYQFGMLSQTTEQNRLALEGRIAEMENQIWELYEADKGMLELHGQVTDLTEKMNDLHGSRVSVSPSKSKPESGWMADRKIRELEVQLTEITEKIETLEKCRTTAPSTASGDQDPTHVFRSEFKELEDQLGELSQMTEEGRSALEHRIKELEKCPMQSPPGASGDQDPTNSLKSEIKYLEDQLGELSQITEEGRSALENRIDALEEGSELVFNKALELEKSVAELQSR